MERSEIRPEIITFLDKLVEERTINLFGATKYLMQRFPELTEADCKQVVIAYLYLQLKEEGPA